MGSPLKKITIMGFKSIRELLDFELGPVNILVGANGSGKSNFIDFFRLLGELVNENIQAYVKTNGGAGVFLFRGPKKAEQIYAELDFDVLKYRLSLGKTTEDQLFVVGDYIDKLDENGKGGSIKVSEATNESRLRARRDEQAHHGVVENVGFGEYFDRIVNCVVYHFHDTTPEASMRRFGTLQGYAQLSPDAGNLAAFLYGLIENHPSCYRRIRDVVNLMAPFLDDFYLEPEKFGNNEKIRLRWKQKGAVDPFLPTQLSDGTLRFICLATSLLQPDPPSTIIIDEPELGLHPSALELFANLLSEAGLKTQVIVSTQAPALLNNFDPHEVVVVDRHDGESHFRRLESESLNHWLEDYSLGELWQKNVFQGSPGYE